jgi:hypothetical protein
LNAIEVLRRNVRLVFILAVQGPAQRIDYE